MKISFETEELIKTFLINAQAQKLRKGWGFDEGFVQCTAAIVY
jgi:hypothetical protein